MDTHFRESVLFDVVKWKGIRKRIHGSNVTFKGTFRIITWYIDQGLEQVLFHKLNQSSLLTLYTQFNVSELTNGFKCLLRISSTQIGCFRERG